MLGQSEYPPLGFKYATALNITKLWTCKSYIGCWLCLICLNMREYALIMPEEKELSICQNSECVSCSISLKVTVQITEQLSRQTYSEYCQTFKIQKIMSDCRCIMRNFSEQERFHGTREKRPAWKHFFS